MIFGFAANFRNYLLTNNDSVRVRLDTKEDENLEALNTSHAADSLLQCCHSELPS